MVNVPTYVRALHVAPHLPMNTDNALAYPMPEVMAPAGSSWTREDLGLPKYIKVSELPKLLGVSSQMAYKLVRTGQIPSTRFGVKYQIDPRDLQEYVRRRRQGQFGIQGPTAKEVIEAYPQETAAAIQPIQQVQHG